MAHFYCLFPKLDIFFQTIIIYDEKQRDMQQINVWKTGKWARYPLSINCKPIASVAMSPSFYMAFRLFFFVCSMWNGKEEEIGLRKKFYPVRRENKVRRLYSSVFFSFAFGFFLSEYESKETYMSTDRLDEYQTNAVKPPYSVGKRSFLTIHVFLLPLQTWKKCEVWISMK